MKVIGTVLAVLGIVLMLALPATGAEEVGPITVDGVEYAPTKVTPGGTVHYETPDVNPQEAFTSRNVWTGNGSEHLPCEGGIHWIDNKNVLTISHCLEVPATTTTTVPRTTTTETPPSTTTTEPETSTTTTVPDTSSTSVPESTTSTSETTTTSENPPTVPSTTPPSTDEPPTTTPGQPELPYTGSNDVLLAGLATALIATGGLLVRRGREVQ